MARLIVEKGHDKGKSVSLLPRGATVFGRDTSANVQIKDTMASRLHFKIEPRADGIWLVDLQSMNGTLLNGHPAKEAKLATGDLIRVGETMYSFLPDDAGTDPLLGQRLGGYKILERVGRGGMGTVYKAEQIDLQRIVALKIISEEHLKNPEFVELFVHEARAAAKLNHPNIVQVYDVKKTNDLYYFSMEFVPGGSVQDLLNTKRKVPVADAVRMILEAARGLDYAHRKEIIHRDVKPDNFMIGEGGTIKIGDLGLAQRLGEKLSADNEDSVIGTPHYIAPEQLLGRPADVRSDVYSLGSTMYRMIAGFTPFQAPSIRELVNKKAREDAIPLHAALEGFPESLGAICAKMMARLPEERTASMSEVIANLEAWTRGSTGGAAAAGEASPVHRKLLVAAVGLLAVVVVGGVIAATAMLGKGENKETAAPPAPVAPADDGSPEIKLDRAVIEESRLVDQKPDEFEDVIKQYDLIVSRWPDSAWGKDAARRGEALKARRVGLMAARGLAALDELDKEAWKAQLAAFNVGKEDLSEADKRERDFRAFADDPAWKGTESGVAAGRRAAAIAAWKAEVEKRRAGYEKLKENVEKGLAERRPREAHEACNEFITELATYAPPAKDRYTTLLFDVPARRLQDRIMEEASRSLDDAVKQAADLESKGDFAGAVAALDAATRHSLKEPAERGRKLLQELHERWSAANKLAVERAAEAQRKLAELDRRDFDAAAKRWREQVLRFDPKSALADAQSIVKSTPDRFPRLAAAEARIAARVAPLKTLAEFKELLVRAWNEKSITNRITLGVLTGPIVKATETHVTVDFGGGSQGETSFADILGGGLGSAKVTNFLDYLRAAGKKDARWWMGLTILDLELGLYERASDDLQNVEKSTDPAAKKFAADWRALVEDFRYPDSDEIEAQKHYDRLLLALKDPPGSPRFDIGRTMLLLRTRFGGTDTYLVQKAQLDEWEKGRAELGAKERDRAARTEVFVRIRAARMKTQADSRGKETATLKGLGNLRDPIEKAYHLGEAHLGFGNLKPSTNALIEAFELAYKKFPPVEKRPPVDPMVNWTMRAGASLMRNFHLLKQEKNATDVRNKIDLKFSDGQTYAPWQGYKDAYDAWTLQVMERVKKHGDRLASLEKDLEENPDPKTLFDLAEAHDFLRNALDARGLYVALLVEFPQYEKSRSGDTLYRLAENTFQLRDVEAAEALYLKMKADFPTHPKVTQAMTFDSVESRLNTCRLIKNNLGPSK